MVVRSVNSIMMNMVGTGSPAVVGLLLVLLTAPPRVAGVAELMVGPLQALDRPELLTYSNATSPESTLISVDINDANPAARSIVVVVRQDTFRISAPNQFRTSSLILSPADERRYIRPYGLASMLASVITTASPDSFHTQSAVHFVNDTTAIVTFAHVTWYDGHRDEPIVFGIDGALLQSARSISGFHMKIRGPDRTQDILWMVLLAAVTVLHAVFDPHGVVDVHILVVVVSLPCAHSIPARIGDGAWRLLSPLGFSHPLEPAAMLGSSIVIVAIVAGLALFGLFRRGRFTETPLQLATWWWNIAAFLLFPSNLASWLLLTRGESAALGFFGFIGIVVFTVAPLALLTAWLYFRRSGARFRRYTWYSAVDWYYRVLYPEGFWVEPFTETCWALVKDSAPYALTALPSTVVRVVVIAIVLGTAPNNAGDCAAVYTIACVGFIVFALGEAALRKRRCVAHGVLDVVVQAALAITCAGGAEQAQESATESPTTMYAGVGIAALALAARAVLLVWTHFSEKSWKADELVRSGDK